jgi:hypothetical protein
VDGLRASETNAGALTVTFVEALMEPELAWMRLFPRETAVAKPALLTVTEEDEDVHVAVEVRSCALPSEYVPVAVNC